MLTVTIPVHPLSRAIIFSEFGSEPVVLDEHDILFEIINTRITPNDLRLKPQLSQFIELTVNNRLAAHLAQYGEIAGARLFKFHKHILCRFVNAQSLPQTKITVMQALRNFLSIYGVTEDDYGLETAWKCHQRFNKEISKKNPHFFAQARNRSGVVLCKKTTGTKPELDLFAEVAVSRFMTAVRFRMKRHHRRLEKQVRAYYYTEIMQMTVREAASAMGVPFRTVAYSAQVMRLRISKNPTYARLLQESLALPEPA